MAYQYIDNVCIGRTVYWLRRVIHPGRDPIYQAGWDATDNSYGLVKISSPTVRPAVDVFRDLCGVWPEGYGPE